jgi:hypothetical protein
MDRHYRRRVLEDSWKAGRKGIPNFPDDSFSSGNAGGKLRVPTQIIPSGEVSVALCGSAWETKFLHLPISKRHQRRIICQYWKGKTFRP